MTPPLTSPFWSNAVVPMTVSRPLVPMMFWSTARRSVAFAPALVSAARTTCAADFAYVA
jgi:hypothetical protein